jgi:hypothetical protein
LARYKLGKRGCRKKSKLRLWSWWAMTENPRSCTSRSDDGDTISIIIPLEGIVLEHMVVGGVRRWSGVASTMSTMGLGDGHMFIDTRRGWHYLALSWRDGWPRKFDAFNPS